jgi:hypothetical protein
MDKAAIFTELTRRNALRREAGLPLLDVRQEFDHGVAKARWEEYQVVCDAHAEGVFDRSLEADLPDRLRADGDGGISLVAVGGGAVVRHVLFAAATAPFRALALAPVCDRGRDLRRRGLDAAAAAEVGRAGAAVRSPAAAGPGAAR